MSTRWDRDEKKKLIELFSKGNSFSDIADKLDRSVSAIRLRLQSIVYDGIARGLTIPDLMGILNIEMHLVLQMFYAHREFKQGRDENVIPFANLDELFQLKIRKGNKSKPKSSIPDEMLGGNHKSDSTDNNSVDASHSTKYAHKLEEQNKVMEHIIKNKILKKQIKVLHKANGLSEMERNELQRIL